MYRMNSFVVGIDLGEKESNTTHISPDGEIKERFNFPMNRDRYTEFRKKIPLETRIAFEAYESAYAVSRALKNLGYNDITVVHPGELSCISKSKKNDCVDSIKLAKLHLVGMYRNHISLTRMRGYSVIFSYRESSLEYQYHPQRILS